MKSSIDMALRRASRARIATTAALAAALLALLIGSAVPVISRFFPTQSSSERR